MHLRPTRSRPTSKSAFVRTVVVAALALGVCVAAQVAAADDPNSDAFTYQGQLVFQGEPVDGPIDLRFRLFDAAIGGTMVGPEIESIGFDGFDEQGRFTIDLLFGKASFNGAARWIEIEVGDVVLAPRQPVMPAPYAIRALTVTTVADGALTGSYTNPIALTNAGNQFAGQFSGGGSGLTGLNASSLSSGTVGAQRLSGGYTNALNFSNAGNAFTGSGLGLTNLNASSITTGALGIARFPTGGMWQLSDTLNIGGLTLFSVNPTTGRVAVGVATATNLLHVAHSDGSSATPAMSAIRVHNTADAAASIDLTTGFRDWTIGQNRPAGGSNLIDSFFIRDRSIDSTRLSINTVGHVMIGEGATSNSRLTVAAESGENPLVLRAGATPTLLAHSNGGLSVGGSATPASSGLRVVGESSYDGRVSIGVVGADARLLVRGTLGEDAFRVRVEGGTKLLVRDNGGLAVGSNFPDVPENGLRVAGLVALNTASPGVFRLACNGDAAKPGGGSWSVFSDERLKRNIQPLAHGSLDRLLGLTGYTFEYLDEAVESRLALPGTQTGLIAQEVERLFPEWVDADAEGFLYVTERGLTPVLVEALRELRNEKDAEIAALRDEVTELRALVERIAAGR